MKAIRKVSMAIIIFWVIVLGFVLKVKADEILHVKSTAYCYNSGMTATGTIPEEGRTLAGKREWFGKTVVVWEDKGHGIEPDNYIGTYICEDTGGETIRNGYVVDIFIEDEQEARNFGSKKVIIQLIDAKG